MSVLITRPEKQGQELAEMLQQHNLIAIHQPFFTIEAGKELTQLPAALSRLNAGDYVFVVSKNAVDYAVETLKQTGFHWRSDLNYLAVGKNSAYYFAEGIEQAVRYPLQSENSEGVLALSELQAIENKQILILRAETGREFLREQATQRGATVHTLEVYQRVPVTDNLAEQLNLCKRAGVDTIVITSSEILSTLFDQTLGEDRQWLLQCRLIVVGERIASLARQLGWTQIAVSAKADNSSLLATVLNVGNT